MRVVALSSGGVDSSVTMLLLKKRDYTIFPLFVNYGQLSAEHEWSACQRICEFLGLKTERMDIQGFGKLIPSGITNRDFDIEKDAFLPTRNLLFLTLGAAYGYAKAAHVVAIGLLSNPIFPDQTSDFVQEAQKTISKALGIDVTVLAPLISLDKSDTLRLAHKYGLPVEYTYSCHAGGENPCSHCISCKERMAAERCLAGSNSRC
jgi:7-cyano-7-deazaguanine synthase